MGGASTGSVTANTVAAPGTLVSSMLPPVRSTASLQNGRPSPVSALGSPEGVRPWPAGGHTAEHGDFLYELAFRHE
jgi:hypothetical protein